MRRSRHGEGRLRADAEFDVLEIMARMVIFSWFLGVGEPAR
jgi:hypothetical protein